MAFSNNIRDISNYHEKAAKIDLSFPSKNSSKIRGTFSEAEVDTIIEETVVSLKDETKNRTLIHRRSSSLTSGALSEDEEDFITFDFQEESVLEQIDYDKWSSKEIRRKNVKLTSKDEKEIERVVKRECLAEFRRITNGARKKQSKLRGDFRKIAEEASTLLVTARIQAEGKSVSKLEEITEQKQMEIYEERLKKRGKVRKGTEPPKEGTLSYKEWVKSRVTEMETIRKLQSGLDRARARRRNSILAGASLDKNGMVDIKNLSAGELRRLEKSQDLKSLIDELSELGIEEKANELMEALESREDCEKVFRKGLYAERKKAREMAIKRKTEEIEKLRNKRLGEKIAELERRERVKKEEEERNRIREELERQKKITAALKRREFNRKMRRSYNNTLIETGMSRSFKFSYFPALGNV